MRSSNPVFSREGSFTRDSGYAGFDAGPRSSAHADNPYAQQAPYGTQLTDQQLAEMYGAPSAGPLQTGRMTMDDVVARTALTLLTLVAAGTVAWFTVPVESYNVAVLVALAAFAVGLVITFKRSVSPPLILLYAGLEGFFLGTLSKVFETLWPGIVIQAVLGTTAVFAATLIAYKSGRIRVTPRYAKIGISIAIGFVILLLVNSIAWAFGADLGLRSGPLGILVGLLGIALGAFFLTLDFNDIEGGIRGGAPQQESWRAAFGLTLSLVWIYLEMLRLIAILRGDD
ncbi:Bax inhibitor-1/YccA family protein [Kitasatospora paracochleata]|uniref:YccA/Bax inhibitor family protein n=1 Tax=Kitasatospora paracochleata TaxID=58354 RepID=A0ABT1IQA9_9ACTN|nr:Bax inhibitor-1/YccA family protein [Kitasatospora paracochleata]MCP2307310.1 putative YccA/Bax inhibitor family protein [Kitasatospora paracochleata]